ncbi:MAG TPA: nucleotidyltransferase family protein [Tepidisphaeraceae bacterium]|jgi:hypothetical protein
MDRTTIDTPSDQLDPATCQFYLRTLEILDAAQIPYCVAGAYALAAYTRIVRHTKDLDVFLRRKDLARARRAFEAAGFRTEATHPHWLAKVFADDAAADAFVDLIFRAASGIWEVDDEWVNHTELGPVVGRTAPLIPPEELIWSKAMVMERNRFDGADIAHVIQARGKQFDWERLLRRARGHEGILLGHLAFYQYIYPCDAKNLPDRVMQELFRRMREARAHPPQSADGGLVCRGTVVSWDQYLFDINEHGMLDGRLAPWGNLTPDEIEQWTEADK